MRSPMDLSRELEFATPGLGVRPGVTEVMFDAFAKLAGRWGEKGPR